MSEVATTGVCKHCGLAIISESGRRWTWVHREGYQRGKQRCAVEPYGFNAGPEGEECPPICHGSEGRVPTTSSLVCESGEA